MVIVIGISPIQNGVTKSGRGFGIGLLEYSQGEEMHKIIANFHTECHIWSTVRHPGVVQFLGTVLWSDRWWTIHSPIISMVTVFGWGRGYTLGLSSAKIETPANRP